MPAFYLHDISIHDIFASNYKFYANNPIPLNIFTNNVYSYFSDLGYDFISEKLLKGMIMFDAFGLYGISYLSEPQNSDEIDFLRYPRDMLLNKVGDCDDLSILYSAALESIGVQTALLDAPTHIFMMFNTGVPEDEYKSISFDRNLLIFYDGTVWIPIEITLFKKNFMTAWERAATECRKLGKKNIKIIDVRKAWNKYPAVTLPKTDFTPAVPEKEDIKSMLEKDITEYKTTREKEILKGNMDKETRLTDDEADVYYIQAKRFRTVGFYQKATETYMKVLKVNKNHSKTLNDLGCIFFIRDNYDSAVYYYKKVVFVNPNNSILYINLALCYYKQNDFNKAKELYQEAVKIDKELNKGYEFLAGITDDEKGDLRSSDMDAVLRKVNRPLWSE